MSSESTGHHPHITPLYIYIGVGTALFLLTAITVVAAQIDLGGTLNLILAMAIATVKAALVALFFMHLLYDNKAYMIVFIGGLLFLMIFIVFTMFDTMRRDGIYAERHQHIESEAKIYNELRSRSTTDDHGADHGAEASHGDAQGYDAGKADARDAPAH